MRLFRPIGQENKQELNTKVSPLIRIQKTDEEEKIMMLNHFMYKLLHFVEIQMKIIYRAYMQKLQFANYNSL